MVSTQQSPTLIRGCHTFSENGEWENGEWRMENEEKEEAIG
jgi:hypothetical protein